MKKLYDEYDLLSVFLIFKEVLYLNPLNIFLNFYSLF